MLKYYHVQSLFTKEYSLMKFSKLFHPLSLGSLLSCFFSFMHLVSSYKFIVNHLNMYIIFKIRTEPSTPQGFSQHRETEEYMWAAQ